MTRAGCEAVSHHRISHRFSFQSTQASRKLSESESLRGPLPSTGRVASGLTRHSVILRGSAPRLIGFGGYKLGVYLQTPKGGTKADLNPGQLAASGALGGMCYWFFPFPFDVVKSKIQTGTHGLAAGTSVNVPNVLQHVFRTEGIKGLYRGCGITVARAAPSNAVLFVAYEMTMRALRGQALLGA